MIDFFLCLSNIFCLKIYVRDRVWFVRLYGEIINRTDAHTLLYLTVTMISSVDLAHYGVSYAKDWGICGLWYNV